MIVPTARAALALALAAPVALVVAAIAPGGWIAAPAFAAAMFALIVADAICAGALAGCDVAIPRDVEVGGETLVSATATFARGARGRVEAAFALDPRLVESGRATMRLTPADGVWTGALAFTPDRRGAGEVAGPWLRWTGPLGLGARQRRLGARRAIRVRPNLAAARSPALQTHLRDARFGLIARRLRGEGSEFEALAEYRAGDDRRRIDWKSSARHRHLLVKEFETERNSQIVFAFDCGQAMCEPVDGVPRIDRAVSAALLTAYVALKGGDRAMLFGFAARPMLATPFVAGARALARLQEAAAGLDYHAEEPNFTLALATLAARLQRRSLVIVFSDFADPAGAELMLESVGRLVARHLVLFVTMVDEELRGLADAPPDSAAALAIAVGADALLRQRALVTRRLRQLGVDVIEARYATIGTRLIDAYLAIKRAGAIG